MAAAVENTSGVPPLAEVTAAHPPNSSVATGSQALEPAASAPRREWLTGSREQSHDHQFAILSRLDNPLKRLKTLKLAQETGEWIAREYGLRRSQALFIKAASLLYDDQQTETTRDEAASIASDTQTGFWDLPRPLRTTFFMLFTAALVQGWTQMGTNGASICWLDPLIRGDTPPRDGFGCVEQDGDVWKYAAISAGPFLFAPIGCLISDPLNELFWGRRIPLIASASLILMSALFGAFAEHWWSLMIWRFVLGIGMGCKAAVTPVFAAEIAPSHLRGSLVMNWQVFDALGIFLGCSANLIASTQGATAWSWQIASAALPAALLLWSLLMISWDSPRFLLRHEWRRLERYQERRRALWDLVGSKANAFKRTNSTMEDQHIEDREEHGRNDNDDEVISLSNLSFCVQLRHNFRYMLSINPALPYQSPTFDTLLALRGSPFLAARDMVLLHCQIVLAQESTKKSVRGGPTANNQNTFSLKPSSGETRWTQWFRRAGEIFSTPHLQRMFAAAAVVMLSQQLCGINVLIFYSSRLFSKAGNQDGYYSMPLAPLFLTWGIGLCNFLAAIPAYWLIESRGRRWLLLTTLPLMAVCMAVAAGCFKIEDERSRTIAVGFFTFLFTILYSLGMGPVTFTLSAEMFPLEHRMVGMSMAVCLNFFAGGLFTLFVPLIKDSSILLGVFSVLNIGAFILVWNYVREVAAMSFGADGKGKRSLGVEQMSLIFKYSTGKHRKYQWKRKGDAWWSFVDFFRGHETPPERSNDFYHHAEKEL